MATQKQGQQTIKQGGRIFNGLQCDSSGALLPGIKGRLSLKQAQAIAAKNPNAPIKDNRSN